MSNILDEQAVMVIPFADGSHVRIINVTPHEITFTGDGGENFTVPPSGVVINAKSKEKQISSSGGVELVETEFTVSEETDALVDQLRDEYPDALIVGSIVAAQALPGRVVAMTPAPGYERAVGAEKRMNPRKFIVFPRK